MPIDQELLDQFPATVEEDEEERTAALEPVEPPESAPSRALVNSVDDLTTLLAAALHWAGDGEEQLPEDWALLDQNADRKSLLLNLAAEQGWLREDESGLRPTLLRGRAGSQQKVWPASQFSANGVRGRCPGTSCAMWRIFRNRIIKP